MKKIYKDIYNKGASMQLQKIFVLRHADFIHSGETVGMCQSEELANRLKPFIDSNSIVVLTSDVDRAWQTAKPICRKFGVQRYIESDIFRWLDTTDKIKAPRSLDLIEGYEEKVEVIIIITHLDYLKWLPATLTEKYCDIGFTGGDRGYARDWMIDIRTMAIEPV